MIQSPARLSHAPVPRPVSVAGGTSLVRDGIGVSATGDSGTFGGEGSADVANACPTGASRPGGCASVIGSSSIGGFGGS